MKQMTNYQRTANYLVKVFKAVNEHYFGGKLETPTITIQSTVGAYGHISTSKVWHNEKGESTYELNIGADYLSRPIEDVVATMIHEACHLYAMLNGIKDTSNRGVYHNQKFKAIAEDMGKLKIDKHPKYGWTITTPTEDTLNFCVMYGFEDILVNRGARISYTGIGTPKAGNSSPDAPKVKKPSSTRKYICPCCGNSFRATKSINVICGDCDVHFVEVQ